MAHIIIQVGAVFSATSVVNFQLFAQLAIKNLSKLALLAGGPLNLPHKFHLYLIKFYLFYIIDKVSIQTEKYKKYTKIVLY